MLSLDEPHRGIVESSTREQHDLSDVGVAGDPDGTESRRLATMDLGVAQEHTPVSSQLHPGSGTSASTFFSLPITNKHVI